MFNVKNLPANYHSNLTYIHQMGLVLEKKKDTFDEKEKLEVKEMQSSKEVVIQRLNS